MWLNWVLSFRVTYRWQPRSPPGLQSSQHLTTGGSKPSALTGGGFSPARAIGQRLPSVPCRRDLSMGTAHSIAAGFTRVSSPKEREREWANETEVTIFCNKISEMIFHHVCHILFIWSKSGSSHDHEYQVAKKSLEATLKVYLLQPPSLLFLSNLFSSPGHIWAQDHFQLIISEYLGCGAQALYL